MAQLGFWSSSESSDGEEAPAPAPAAAGRTRRRPQVQKTHRRWRGKAKHTLALKPSFWKGLEKGGSQHPLVQEANHFNLAEWVDTCYKLFPRTLTALLNSHDTKCPKWLLNRWKPFAALPIQKRLRG